MQRKTKLIITAIAAVLLIPPLCHKAVLYLRHSAGPAGELISFTLDGSDYYPGTTRTINVYIPKEYRGDEAACAIVRLDGFNNSMMLILDDLIREGSVPPAIGIGIAPGMVCSPDGEVIRNNRSYEFDRMTGTLAEFIETEVIPAVESRTAGDGRRIMISRRPRDRMITGGSSGAMAAFNAAWQRPDLYSRVFSVIGSFVPMRGGDSFPALIRKTEPKPVRVFLQDNDEDSWNRIFGSWYEYNRLMASALEFAGYDAYFHWGKGGHSGANALAKAKDALRFLWKGWPEGIEVPEGENELLSELLIPGEGWTPCDSLGAEPSAEALYPGGSFIARPKAHTNCIRTAFLDENGIERHENDFYWLHQEEGDDESGRCLAFDAEGFLYASSALGIQVCDHKGRVRAILNVPVGRLESFSFADDRLYVKVDGKCFSRRIAHRASTADSPRPVVPEE